MVHVTCVMCYTGIELHCAQGVLIYLLVRMSSALGSQSLVTWVADEAQSHVHTSLWRTAHGLHFMSSVSLA